MKYMDSNFILLTCNLPSPLQESDGGSVDDNPLNDSNECGMNPSSSEDDMDDDSATDEDSGEEVWNDLVLKDLLKDIENPTPLPAKEDK